MKKTTNLLLVLTILGSSLSSGSLNAIKPRPSDYRAREQKKITPKLQIWDVNWNQTNTQQKTSERGNPIERINNGIKTWKVAERNEQRKLAAQREAELDRQQAKQELMQNAEKGLASVDELYAQHGFKYAQYASKEAIAKKAVLKKELNRLNEIGTELEEQAAQDKLEEQNKLFLQEETNRLETMGIQLEEQTIQDEQNRLAELERQEAERLNAIGIQLQEEQDRQVIQVNATQPGIFDRSFRWVYRRRYKIALTLAATLAATWAAIETGIIEPKTIVNNAKATCKYVINDTKRNLNNTANGIKRALNNIPNDIRRNLRYTANDVKRTLNNIPNDIKRNLKYTANDIKRTLNNTANGIKRTLNNTKSLFGNLWNKFRPVPVKPKPSLKTKTAITGILGATVIGAGIAAAIKS